MGINMLLTIRKALLSLSISCFSLHIYCHIAEALDKGDLIPKATLTSIDGHPVALRSPKVKLLYLDFWASWCAPCRVSLPWMNTLQKKYGSKGLMIVGVNTDTDINAAKEALKEVHPSFIVAIDPKKEFVAKFNPPKMPTSYLIDSKGKIINVHGGFTKGDGAELEKLIVEQLKSN